MVPLSTRSRWLMQRSIVDFPAPEGPMTQTTSPAFTSSETSFSTRVAPNDLLMPSSRIMWPRLAGRRGNAGRRPTCIRLSRYFTKSALGYDSPK